MPGGNISVPQELTSYNLSKIHVTVRRDVAFESHKRQNWEMTIVMPVRFLMA